MSINTFEEFVIANRATIDIGTRDAWDIWQAATAAAERRLVLDDLLAEILTISIDQDAADKSGNSLAYKLGCQDTRHAAAELVLLKAVQNAAIMREPTFDDMYFGVSSNNRRSITGRGPCRPPGFATNGEWYAWAGEMVKWVKGLQK